MALGVFSIRLHTPGHWGDVLWERGRRVETFGAGVKRVGGVNAIAFLEGSDGYKRHCLIQIEVTGADDSTVAVIWRW